MKLELVKYLMFQTKYDIISKEVIEGITIYEGTTHFIKDNHLNNIEIYKNIVLLFTPLKPSTLTAKGQFSNVQFNEEEIIDSLTIPSGCNILKVGCNFGEIFNEDPPFIPLEKPKRKSNRGRKPKEKKITRKTQGTGKYFSSQMQALVFNRLLEKILKIKIFRNGVFQVPGIYDKEMRDLIQPAKDLRKWLRHEFSDNSIEIVYFISVMRNYTCKLLDDGYCIILDNLKKVLLAEKRNTDYRDEVVGLLKNQYWHRVIPYVGKSSVMRIAEIQYDVERYSGLMVKFRRPVPWNTDKKTTIKILGSGKINFDGCNSEIEAIELFYWLQSFFHKHRKKIIYDENSESDESSSSGSGESIYDDMLESEDDDDEGFRLRLIRAGISYHKDD